MLSVPEGAVLVAVFSVLGFSAALYIKLLNLTKVRNGRLLGITYFTMLGYYLNLVFDYRKFLSNESWEDCKQEILAKLEEHAKGNRKFAKKLRSAFEKEERKLKAKWNRRLFWITLSYSMKAYWRLRTKIDHELAQKLEMSSARIRTKARHSIPTAYAAEPIPPQTARQVGTVRENFVSGFFSHQHLHPAV